MNDCVRGQPAHRWGCPDCAVEELKAKQEQKRGDAITCDELEQWTRRVQLLERLLSEEKAAYEALENQFDDLQRAAYQETKEWEAIRDKLVDERDEAHKLILRIGLALRAWVNQAQQGWTPGAIAAIYELIDAQPWVQEGEEA